MARICEGIGHNCALRELQNGPDGWAMQERSVTCLCTREKRLCTPRTRIWCHIRETGITAVWRVETGSWNAGAQAQTGLLMLVEAARELRDFLSVDLTISEQSRDGGRRRFYIPQFRISELAPRTAALVAEERGLPALGVTEDPRLQLTDDSHTDLTGDKLAEESQEGMLI